MRLAPTSASTSQTRGPAGGPHAVGIRRSRSVTCRGLDGERQARAAANWCGGRSTSGAGGVALAAPGPVPHLDGVRVPGVDAAPDGCLDAVDGVVHGGEQLRPTVPVQPVGVGDESQPRRPVGGSPAEPGLVDVVLDRDAEAGELGEVVDRAARGGELEVEQRDRDAVTEDDVRGLHVVVAHERPARRVGQAVVPGETAWVEPAGGVVQPAQQPRDGRQRGVGLAPVRIGRHGHVSVDELEPFAPVLVDADR